MALQCRALQYCAPISNELTSNPVNLGPLMSCCNPVRPVQALGESISYASRDRVPISNELTSNPVNPGPLMSCWHWKRVLAIPCNIATPFLMNLPVIL